MTERPSVSIVIPVYNGANYLGAAIESALAQTYAPCEVVVVNDGSTDGGATHAVAQSFGERIRYVEKPNGGVATALNAGIEAMRGDLFSWLSHDDLYQPWKVERQVETWRRFGPRCVVIGDFETMDESGAPLQVISLAGHNLFARPLDAVFRGLINGCALLVPRTLFDEAGLFEPGLPTTQDYHLWYRMARLVPFAHCPGAGVRQRMHPLQGSRQMAHLTEAGRTFIHLLESTPPELMRDYEGSELRFLLKLNQGHGSVYPALGAYLQNRIDKALSQVRYAVAWTSAPAEDLARTVDAYHPPPMAVAAATIDPADAARLTPGADIIAFLRPDPPPSPAQLRTGLEALFLAGTDAARPWAGSPKQSPMDGTLIWSDALATLVQTPDQISWTTYVGTPSIAELAAAFDGTEVRDYHRFVPEPALLEALTARLGGPRPVVLLLAHAGGGTWTHLHRLATALARHAQCLVCLGEAEGVLRLRKATAAPDDSGGIVFRTPQHLADLARILRALGVVRVDVQSSFGFEDVALRLIDSLGRPADATLLDYHAIATDPHLRQSTGRFVDDPELLRSLLRADRSGVLDRAERVFAVSRDLIARLHALSPDLAPSYAPPWPEMRNQVRHVFVPTLQTGEKLRILIQGTLVAHKGLRIVLDAAREAAARSLPLEFHHLGAFGERGAAPPSLVLHGPFTADRHPALVSAIAPHVGWLPAQVPETWSYVLSEFMSACLPIAASAIGALIERCHGRPATWLLPPDTDASAWVEFFLLLHATRMQLPPRWAPVDHLPDPQAVPFEDYLRPILHAPGAMTEG